MQLLQCYLRAVELEMRAAEEPLRPGDMALPEGTLERIREWAEGQETKEREKKELEEEISQVMSAHGHDPTPIRQTMGR